MATFLIRDASNTTRGFRELTPPDGTLPRSKSESYVPWAIYDGNRVVYAKTGEHGSWNGGTTGGRRSVGTMAPYDTAVSQRRRRLAESELGMMALQRTFFSKGAVDSVSKAIKRYLTVQMMTDMSKTQGGVYDLIGDYFFTGGRTGFGRISEANKKSVGQAGVWNGIMHVLEGGSLAQQLAVHDAIGRKILMLLGGEMKDVYVKWGKVLRQKWFDDKALRGRADVRGSKATTVGGTAPVGSGMATTDQSRNRGVDMFKRDLERTRDVLGDAYYDDVDARNLLFGAGISGTTGTLLQAGIAFGKLPTVDLKKQYVFGIIGYLVGGGMHSYHESMAVATKAGVPYDPGKFERSLPDAFVISPDYRKWRDDYYDVVVLGATHWLYNSGVTHSHLNPMLKPAP